MSGIYRSMLKGDDGLPKVEDTAKGLGIRPDKDIPVNQGWVAPGTGGMSVAPAWRKLPVFRIPGRLRDLTQGEAVGSNDLHIYRLGEAQFAEAALTASLNLRIDKPYHGLIEPAYAMSIEDLRARLSETREEWTIDEQ